MDIPKKDNQPHIITHADSDTAPDLMPIDAAREMHMVRVRKLGQQTLVTNILGNTLIANSLPAGTNMALGYGKSEDQNKLYWINYNSNGYHGVYVFDSLTGAVTPVLRNLTDTNGVDIMHLSPDYLINHIDIVGKKLIYWVDGLNKARKFNIDKAIDKSATGYGSVITEDFITAYKQCGIYAPSVVYFTDLTRTSNYLYGQQYKFCYRYHYDDGEQSNWGDWSAVPLPPNESYLGKNSITFDNNCIKVTVETGNKLVTKIELAVKINDLDWVSAVILKKQELGIVDYGIFVYNFYNDGSYDAIDQDKVNRPYSFMPRVPFAQSFVKVAMTYTHADEGYETVLIKAALSITYKPFYLPPGTVSQLNNPLFTESLVSTSEHGGIFNSWWTSVTHFVIGQDVKNGNKFTIYSYGGNGFVTFGGAVVGGTSSALTIVANLTDDATTIAYKIKQYLYSIDAVGKGIVSNEVIDGSGNVSWDFTIEAHEGKPAIGFKTSVTPVNYSTLLDNGLSINTIKQGSTVKYGVVYETDDNPTSNTYTADALLAKTAFETDVLLGQTSPLGLQQPIHTISILNQPPAWAKYWRLVRTNSYTDFIQLLIQQVNEVTVANQPTYLDMVVGSLFTYQKIHPDTILKYEFVRGDRLRLISNENTTPPTPYTPSFETEVLSYSINTEEFVNSNIVTDGTNEVKPDKAVDVNYIGKSIVINDIERTIVGINADKYVLDDNINADGFDSAENATIPNYKFVDRRGILRIKKPTGITVVSLSKIEVYHPQKNSNDFLYQNFYDFQQKFPIVNWGTATRSHGGNIQNQDGTSAATLISTPAIIQVTQGDAYVRNRALPSNNANPNPQVIIDQICDPNFSDFYQSNLYSTGKVYPLDRGFGVVKFGARTRFSNNYIEGTQINGLNDFNNTDRKDYNDNYGTTTLTRFRNGYMFFFKEKKTAWTPVGQKIVKDNNDSDILATSDQLLNELIYAEWEGGIGDNGESWCSNGNSQYYASANSGTFIRVAQNGSTPISMLYKYDKRAKEILSLVEKYKLRIHGGIDVLNGEALWSLKSYIEYLFNNTITAGDWQSVLDAYPAGTTWAITQQPVNSIATVVGDQIQITSTDVLGDDYFKFRGTLPDTSLTPVINFCFTVIADTNRTKAWRVKTSTLYCVQRNTEWRVKTSSLYCLQRQTAWRKKSSSLYCLQVPTLTAIIHTADKANPYSDSNCEFKNDGVSIVRQTGTGTTSWTVPSGKPISFEGFSENPSTGANPTKTMRIERNGVTVYGPTTEDNNPGDTSLLFAETGVDHATYEVWEDADADAFDPDVTGILVVDIYGDTTLNVIGYVNTPSVDPYQEPVYAGNNFYPVGPSPEACYALSSDVLAGPPVRRFEFNVAALLSQYPGESTFEFVISGRSASAGTIAGQYNLKGAAAGKMIMSGSPGSYTPSTSGTTNIGTVTYSGKAVVGGADGTYGLGVGAVILTFQYDVYTKTMTLL